MDSNAVHSAALESCIASSLGRSPSATNLYSLDMARRRILQVARWSGTASDVTCCVVSHPPAAVERLGALASVLTEHSVPYAAIGGFALWRWLPNHQPADIDIVVAPGRRTRTTLPGALGDILARWPLEASTTQYFPPPDLLAAGREVTIATRSGLLQIVGVSLPAGCDRRAIVGRREWLRLGAMRVAICTLTDLISIKRGTGRSSDARHAQALQALGGTGAQ